MRCTSCNVTCVSGIGGLAAALALQRRGIKCAVYERDALFQDRKQGYGLTLSNTPNGGLAKLGILEECIRQDCNSNAHWVFTPEVSVVHNLTRNSVNDN
jgi:2-polyprenyl-6-methoxyphenol hydroxylase-like FAD-dependent oxidoreductase